MAPGMQLALAALVGSQLVSAIPTHARQASVKRQQDELLDAYDYIVVGAGTAGLTVADRLSESGEYTVLVVEYGYLDSTPSITAQGPDARMPGVNVGLPSATRMYNITSKPLPELNGRPRSMAAGCVVGGSSAVNGMFFDRGSAEDYDAWVLAAGDYQESFGKEWGWDNILPWFKKSVTFHPPTIQMQEEFQMTSDVEGAYGGSTPIHSSYSPYQWAGQQVMWDAFKEIPGIDFPVEGADGNATGVFWCPSSIEPVTRTRSYSKLGHYTNPDGAATRENFHLYPAHRVTQLVMGQYEEDADGPWIAGGVVITPRDGDWPEGGPEEGPTIIMAKKEVVLSAGTVHTPQVLERSGIGPKDILEAAGAPVRVDLPGVGNNLQDHMHMSMGYRYETPAEPNDQTLSRDPEFAAMAMELWEANKTGPHSAYVNSGAFLPLTVTSDRAEELVAALLAQDPAEYLEEGTHPTVVAGFASQVQVLAQQFMSRGSSVLEVPFSGRAGGSLILMKPLSRGTMHIAPDDDGVSITGRGNMEPQADWRSFTNPLEVEIALDQVKWWRYFMSSPYMVEKLHPVETSPGANVESDEDIKAWIRSAISTSNGHMVGTAALGPIELGGVVDPGLLVYGTERLSVADNSIMTTLPGTHTSSTAYAIGEKAADLVLRRAKMAAKRAALPDRKIKWDI